jgi:hypothetical protein
MGSSLGQTIAQERNTRNWNKDKSKEVWTQGCDAAAGGQIVIYVPVEAGCYHEIEQICSENTQKILTMWSSSVTSPERLCKESSASSFDPSSNFGSISGAFLPAIKSSLGV